MKKSPGPAKKPLTRKTSIFQRAGLVIFGLSLLVLVELILRLVPLGLQSAEDSDPFVGFSELHPLYTSYRAPDGSQRLKTSPAKLRWFNEQDFAARKEPGTFRIFSLGGSTTFGRPFKDATSFSGWLRVLLKRPAGTSGRRYEVINAGGISYASYRVAVVLKELLAYEPDLFVIYTGHNEFLEARTYGDFFFQRTKAFKARELLSKLKSYRLLDGLWQGLRERPGRGGFRQGQGPGLLTPEVQTMLDQSAGLDYYQRDSLFSRGVFEHFRFNVARMISACRRAGVPVVFMDPVDNTSDFSPFKSQHSAGLPSSERAYFARLEAQGKALLEAGRVDQGIRLIEQAAALDSLFAGVHYRLGRAYIEAGDTARAWDHLVRARELDVCPLRAQEPIHRFLQEETAGAGVDLLNLPALYARNSPGGLLGMAMLTDHIHPTPEGNMLIALELLHWMADRGCLEKARVPQTGQVEEIYRSVSGSLSDEYYRHGIVCLAKVLFWAKKNLETFYVLDNQWEVVKGEGEAQYLMGAALVELGKPGEAAACWQRALALDPGHPVVLSRLAGLYSMLGQTDSAKAAYEEAIKLFPDDSGMLSDYAILLSRMGETGRALEIFQRIKRIESDLPGLDNNMGLVFSMSGDYRKAVQAFGRAAEKESEAAQANFNLGLAWRALGEQEKAERAFLESLRRNPDNDAARANLGYIYQETGKSSKAEEQFRLALVINPDNPAFYIDLARLYRSEGRDSLASDMARLGLTRFPQEKELKEILKE